ncbi:hypothetical protein P7C73_g2044, partial [Tremellales sp. Uapishka_1]
MGDALAVEDQRSILSTQSCLPEPDTISKLVKRIRALVTKLLPVEVDISDISDATSSIITPEVINSFAKCGGDFGEAVPFALLRAKATFLRDAYANPADYDEGMVRATACEVLARRIVHNLPVDRLESVMSTRLRYKQLDGDDSPPTSALELAIDGHSTIFLASTEAQFVVQSLWKGDWVQRNNENDDIDYVHYDRSDSSSFWGYLNPQRMSVPRYQSTIKIIVWLVFLFVYSQTVQSPVDSLDPEHHFDAWEFILYTMTASFLVEEGTKTVKTLRLTPKPFATIGFWTVVQFVIDVLLLSAFAMRLAGLNVVDNEQAKSLQFKSFQVLSCAAPLIWMKLFTVFDGFQIVGVLQVIVFRMLRESAIFFMLLTIMGIGFFQSMYALDAADGESGGGEVVINALVQALLASPDFSTPSERFGYPFGLIIYYSWNFMTTIILVNVLIALFGSAYSDVAENATDEYLAFFAHKTIDLIRAPDSYVYPAPFNLIEAIFIAPLEWFVSREWYIRINKFVMTTIFFIPLVMIAFFESQIHHSSSRRVREYFSGPPPEEEGDPKIEDPECDDEQGDLCKMSFGELSACFPNTALTESAVILKELEALKEKMNAMEKLLKDKVGKQNGN